MNSMNVPALSFASEIYLVVSHIFMVVDSLVIRLAILMGAKYILLVLGTTQC
jgi:hypothetical protein